MATSTFEQAEQTDGVRLAWNVWPPNRLEAVKMTVPLGILYTPLIRPDEVTRLPYAPIVCENKRCDGIINPWIEIDHPQNIWICPLCLARNPFPQSYSHINPENLPAEVDPNCTTIEFEPEDQVGIGSPTFLFVVDTALPSEELEALKQALIENLEYLPEDSWIGLITFGKHVSLHEIGFVDCDKCVVFRGDIEDGEKSEQFTVDRVKELLGIIPSDPASIGRFFGARADISEKLVKILNEMTPDPWPRKQAERPMRCTGVAALVGVALLEAAAAGYSARLLLFSGGAPTVGPGRVVSIDLADRLRAHRDIVKGNAPLFDPACKFYQNLAQHAVNNGHVVDIVACCLDQVGVAEQRVLVDTTGGALILSDTFMTSVFHQSFAQLLMVNESGVLSMCFNSEIRVITSRFVKVCGCIGPVSAIDAKSSSVSEREVGLGGTCKWSCGGLFPNTTLSFMFDVASTNAADVEGKFGYVQFVTTYRTSYGTNVTRVTTMGLQFADPAKKTGKDKIMVAFDQEAAAVILARLAVYKADTEFQPDLLRWIDRQLIQLVSKFAEYQKGDVTSFNLTKQFEYFPQFMYYLRRSQFMQVFNYSPDESAFFRSTLLRENVANSLTMIQPTLHSYNLDGDLFVEQLQLSARAPDKILLLDTFFHIVVWYGRDIAAWKKDHVEEQEEYAWFGDILAYPIEESQSRAAERFPYPNIIECEEGQGQARFLVAKLNPDTSGAPTNDDEPQVFTDDVTLVVFMQHLKRLAVDPQ